MSLRVRGDTGSLKDKLKLCGAVSTTEPSAGSVPVREACAETSDVNASQKNTLSVKNRLIEYKKFIRRMSSSVRHIRLTGVLNTPVRF
ncbi:hypothetical protein GCM10008943_22830 [Paenochrobactrum glaciei]|uniref:Uncharacterized protein n=1 Tax=Paenochrobactrum glaciei TaxID=486407 RepID=A0ABN1G9G1_9HYPH